MNKYIDADKLIAEIERRKYEWQALLDKNNAVNPTAVEEVIYEDLNILNIISSLQREQPKVDLEKEIEEYCGDRSLRPVPDLMEQVARHFAEWGAIHLNTRKEE